MTKNSMLRMFVTTRLVSNAGRHTAIEHALNKWAKKWWVGLSHKQRGKAAAAIKSRRPMSADLFVGAPWFDKRKGCIIKGRSDSPMPRSVSVYEKHYARMRQRANRPKLERNENLSC